jgi:copper homeostasis protein
MKAARIEVCCNSLQSALNAQIGGAYRVELCDNLYEGGTTPSAASILLAREKLKIDLNVLIRPRGGDFVYHADELEIIRRDIAFCKSAGVDGVVMGFLHPDGSIDEDVTREMITLARPMTVTFHRAFDMCKDAFAALDQLVLMGVDRILSSGQKNKATEGAALLSKLVEIAGDRIIIMPGSGIRPENIQELSSHTKASEFHVSAGVSQPSPMMFRREGIFMGGLAQIPEYEQRIIDADQIRAMVDMVSLNEDL